jgi:hypothetical protein
MSPAPAGPILADAHAADPQHYLSRPAVRCRGCFFAQTCARARELAFSPCVMRGQRGPRPGLAKPVPISRSRTVTA